jgi:hypothetical protein
VIVPVLHVLPLCEIGGIRHSLPLVLGWSAVRVRALRVEVARSSPALHLKDGNWANVLAMLASGASLLLDINVHGINRVHCTIKAFILPFR